MIKAIVLMLLIPLFAQAEQGTHRIIFYIKAKSRDANISVVDQTLCDKMERKTKSSHLPIGAIIKYPKAEELKNPTSCGYLETDGRSVADVDYPRLYSVMGCTFSCVDSTHFTIPNTNRPPASVNQH